MSARSSTGKFCVFKTCSWRWQALVVGVEAKGSHLYVHSRRSILDLPRVFDEVGLVLVVEAEGWMQCARNGEHQRLFLGTHGGLIRPSPRCYSSPVDRNKTRPTSSQAGMKQNRGCTLYTMAHMQRGSGERVRVCPTVLPLANNYASASDRNAAP